MSYAETLLASGERIIRRDHQHWFMLVWRCRYALTALALAVVVFLVGGALGTEGPIGIVRALLGWATLALVVGGSANLVWTYLDYRQEEYVITSRRIMHTEGVVNKRVTDSSLEKINDAVLTQSFLGRMFGFGDLDVLTAAETGIERLRMLIDAPGFKRAMLDAKHELELEYTRPVMPPLRATGGEPPGRPPDARAATLGGEPAAPVAAPLGAAAGSASPAGNAAALSAPRGRMSADEVATALDRLADLRDRGVVTVDEFEAKKRELLDRL